MKIRIFMLLTASVILLASCQEGVTADFDSISSDSINQYIEFSSDIEDISSTSTSSAVVSQPDDKSSSAVSDTSSEIIIPPASSTTIDIPSTPADSSEEEEEPITITEPLDTLYNSLESYVCHPSHCCTTIPAAVSHYFEKNFNIYRYYYSKLSSSAKEVYDKIDQEIKKGKAFAEISFNGNEDAFNKYYQDNIWPAYYTYVLDNSWAFFLPSAVSVSYNGSVIKIKFPFIYTDTEILDTFAKIHEFILQAQSNLSSSMSEFEKELSLYNFVCHSIIYTQENPKDAYNLTGAVNGKGVCEAYSEMLKLLFDSVGLKSMAVVGSSKENNEGHKWNMVCIDGQYAYVDATYGDTSTSNKGETKYILNADNSKDAVINYAYFNIDDISLLKINTLKKQENSYTFPSLPSCSAHISYYDHYKINIHNKQEAEEYLKKVAYQIKIKGKRYFHIQSDALTHDEILGILQKKHVRLKKYTYTGAIERGSLVEITI
ncbi:MAG: hypothetical protein E7480_00525 [Ruminococcaceae bacterium]|nr:hypothetical protein [Oscillospiraceae bacterium]